MEKVFEVAKLYGFSYLRLNTYGYSEQLNNFYRSFLPSQEKVIGVMIMGNPKLNFAIVF